MDNDNRIEQAFAHAIKTDLEENHDTPSHPSFNDDIEKVIPQLFNQAFKSSENIYDGAIFNQYEIKQKIASGGMGDIYLAKRNDGQYDKNVAIKILSQGYNNANYKERFLREKQILAELRHPNIVPLIDAGETSDGIPWFVLEYIDGQTINAFFKNQHFSQQEIIKLILKICDALHCAHGQDIIHRDIKPSNILVETIDNNHNPVILDFGIAYKQDNQELTADGNIIGTPGYMSPEQVKGDDTKIDHRTDIFSLGVILYEVFSNHSPFAADTALKSHHKTIHHQQKNLSTTVANFPKDLQTIINTCLKKQAKERYQSVLELKHDLENWLNGYPITAKKDNIMAMLGGLIKRHKFATAVFCLFFLLAISSFAKYTYDINQERQMAIAAKHESDDLLNFLLNDLNQELTEIGRIDLLQSVAQKSLTYLKKYDDDFSSSQDIKHAISYRNIANVLAMQQDLSDAEVAYKNSADILNAIIINEKDNTKALSLLASTHDDMARLQAKKGQLSKANDSHQQSIIFAQQLASLDSQLSPQTLWSTYLSYSWNLMESSKHDEALNMLNTAIQITNDQLQQNNNSLQWLNNKQKTLTAFGWYYIDLREMNNAQQQYLQAQEINEKLLDKTPNSVPLINDLQKIRNQLAYAYLLEKNHIQAAQIAEKSVEIGKILHIKAPNNRLFYRELAYAYTVLGESYQENMQLNLAEENFINGLKISEEIAALSPDSESLQNDLAIDTLNFANVLYQNNKKTSARDYWFRAEKIIEKIAQADNASIYYIDTYVSILLVQGKTLEAQPYLEQLKNTEGWAHDNYLKLVKKYKL